MPTPPLTDEQCLEALEAYERHYKSWKRAADEIGLSKHGFEHRLKIARKRGLHLSSGARRAMQGAGVSGTEARGGWIHNYDEEGKKTGATYWKAPTQDDIEDIGDKIRSALDGLPAISVVPAPQHVNADLLTVYPIADAHIGMKAWADEAGEDYDAKIATDRLQSWIAQCVDASPASEQAIILDVGDLTHADDHSNMTPASKHVLDVDTRHMKTLDMTIVALSTSIECALRKHDKVTVRILRGNHNPNAYLTVMFALSERFRDNPRVTVEKNPDDFFAFEFGQVMICAHHGDKAKADRMVMRMADAHAEMWGRTLHRFLFTGHLHHHKSQDIGGVQWEQLRAVTVKDAYAASHSYSARSQLQAITFHKDNGEISRVKVSA